jgi:broad specificity phosphatase PhoE
LYGRLPRFRLTDRGWRQAKLSANRLKNLGIDAIHSSPLLRARQTAEAIVGLCGPLKLHISVLLNEVHSAYEGAPGADVDNRRGDIYTGAAPCYEQPEDLVVRTLKFILRVRRNHPGGRIAAVTHGDIITFIVLWARGYDLTPGNKNCLLQAGYPEAYPAHASITTLTYHTDTMEEKPSIDYFRP